MTWKSYAAWSGAGLLATYLFSAPPAVGPARPPVGSSADGAGAPRVADDIEAQAARLASHVRTDVEYQPPARNPFRFGTRASAPTSPAAARPVESPALPLPEVLPPPPPPIRLTGIATNTVNGERQRSAVVLTADGIVTAREGDLAGAYRIVRIDEDAIEVVGPDGVARRLVLRP